MLETPVRPCTAGSNDENGILVVDLNSRHGREWRANCDCGTHHPLSIHKRLPQVISNKPLRLSCCNVGSKIDAFQSRFATVKSDRFPRDAPAKVTFP
ncbi:hypothetical protein PLANPX_2400 [Lacipirellula parvula]|uniref:Uncharacterized protein n=1 Tax=Lacipirellula parvula TaxID=2650471 RepID=A0A5K7X8B1_9BACT|nr:hypothetical protein PLANPX_2400 [Lacipirellula parvula]